MTGADELQALREQVSDLPHADGCRPDIYCWCALRDVLELIEDRLLMLEQEG